MNTGGRWEHFEHQADVGVRGIGPTLSTAFEQAAVAVTAAITDPSLVRPSRAIQIVCRAPDREQLLVDWLNAVILRMAAERMLFGRFDVSADGTTLEAEAWGERIDPARHRPAVEVKGASYAELSVDRRPDGQWVAQCIVDV